MTSEQLKELLARIGAIISDSHVVYTKGDHGTAYVNKDVLYEDPRDVSKVCEEIASQSIVIVTTFGFMKKISASYRRRSAAWLSRSGRHFILLV